MDQAQLGLLVLAVGALAGILIAWTALRRIRRTRPHWLDRTGIRDTAAVMTLVVIAIELGAILFAPGYFLQGLFHGAALYLLVFAITTAVRTWGDPRDPDAGGLGTSGRRAKR